VAAALSVWKDLDGRVSHAGKSLNEPGSILRLVVILQLPNHLAQHAEQEFRVSLVQLKTPRETPNRTLKGI
jgi:hypothetical protein